MGATNFTNTIHKMAYAAIDACRPDLSQAGKVVLITGSSSGIGYSIARSFGKAGAAKVIVTGRRQMSLDKAIASLGAECPATNFVAQTLDLADKSDFAQLWNKLDDQGVVVDVLVLSAARMGSSDSMLDRGHHAVFEDFLTNALVNISAGAIHDFERAGRPDYSASKAAGTVVLQQIARGVSPDDMQVVSFHPGSVFTSAAESAGHTRDSMDWDDENLPGNYAVWAASTEAAFLHGRFTWASWDVEELGCGHIRERIDEDTSFLKVTVAGL